MGVRRIYRYYYPKRFWDVLADGAFPEGWGTLRETLDNLDIYTRQRSVAFRAVSAGRYACTTVRGAE